MLARVIEIDNLNGSRKVQSDKVPNSFGAVAQHDPLEGPAPAPPPSFRTDSSAKLFCALDRPGVRRGIRIAGPPISAAVGIVAHVQEPTANLWMVIVCAE